MGLWSLPNELFPREVFQKTFPWFSLRQKIAIGGEDSREEKLFEIVGVAAGRRGCEVWYNLYQWTCIAAWLLLPGPTRYAILKMTQK